MQIIPVLDLAGGIAVHARAGHRAGYQPVRSALAPGTQGDAVALLRGFREVLGASVCYVADLDAIQGGPIQRTLLAELAESVPGASGSLLVDAGTHSPQGALELLSCGASAVVVGLETLRRFADLAVIVSETGRSRVVFSLDLKLGRPILHPELRDADRINPRPTDLAARAIDAGVRSMLVLDVGRVGTGCGVELALVEALRRRFPAVRLLAGGGIVARKDLEELRRAGCAGALVASAIHSGTITADDVAALAGPLAGDQSPARA
jgi:phosphoribosylformimino-5-aminoimidazole carboxamide ribotide isomerase